MSEKSLQNYIWLLEHTASHQVAVIDPTEAELVQDYCAEHGLTVSQIWLTHWHKDHIGGVPELIQGQNLPRVWPTGRTKQNSVYHPSS